MADKSICKIDGCDKSAYSRGWCQSHYARWFKHGDPRAGRTARGEATRFFEKVVLSYDGDECLIWPYNATSEGYGLINYKGKMQSAHRLACIEVHGVPPSPKHEAAHSCGNGHLGCVNPRHLAWKTHIDNEVDKLSHGTRVRGEMHPKTKLTEADVRKIRSLRGVISQQKIAELYSVGQAHISEIQRGVRWAWLE